MSSSDLFTILTMYRFKLFVNLIQGGGGGGGGGVGGGGGGGGGIIS